jgi:membrane protease YdiL (CAAX protease family)
VTEPIRPARHSAPKRFILLHFTCVALVNLVLFAGGAFQPLASATGGLITGSLVANVIFLIVLVTWVMLVDGDLRLTDIGIRFAGLPFALAASIALWLVAQIIHAIAGLLAHGVIQPAWVWNSAGAYILIGGLLAQVFGNALFEEIAYRGFLFPQVYLRLTGLEELNWIRLIAAVLISQSVFALSHIPNRLYLGMTPGAIVVDLVVLLGIGVFFTVLYLYTDNLFLLVGIHALGNAPTTWFRTAPFLEGAGESLLIYALVIAACWAAWWGGRRLRALHDEWSVHTGMDDLIYHEGDFQDQPGAADGTGILHPPAKD